MQPTAPPAEIVVPPHLSAFLAALFLSDLGPILAGPLVGAVSASDLAGLTEADLKALDVPLVKAKKLVKAVAETVRDGAWE